MSRSYKKHYRVKDHNKGQKQKANQIIRRGKNKLSNMKGGEYKKMYPTWDICDYNWYWSKEKAIKEWEDEESEHYEGMAWRHSQYETLEKWLEYWEKCVKRK